MWHRGDLEFITLKETLIVEQPKYISLEKWNNFQWRKKMRIEIKYLKFRLVWECNKEDRDIIMYICFKTSEVKRVIDQPRKQEIRISLIKDSHVVSENII